MAVTDPFVERMRPTLLPALLLRVSRAYASLFARKTARVSRRAIHRLSGHELADIGLTPADLTRRRTRR